MSDTTLSDRKFLLWIHDRIVNVYRESPNIDFMHRLRDVIAKMPEDQPGPKWQVGQKVRYRNHVVDYDICTLTVESVGKIIVASTEGGSSPHEFHLDGTATWSPNLSIAPTDNQS